MRTPSVLRLLVAASLVAAVLTPVASAKGDGPTTIAIDAHAVWIGFGNGTVRRVDPRTRRVGRPIRMSAARDRGPSVKGLAVGFGYLWAATGEADLVRVDPRTGGRREIFRRAGGWTPSLVEVGAGAVWVGDYERNVVYRYDPRRNRVTRGLAVAGRLMQLAVGPGGVWAEVYPGRGPITSFGPRLIVRLAPHRSAPFRVHCDQWLAVGAGGVWLSDLCAPRLTRMDASTGRPVASRRVRRASAIAFGFGSVWVLGKDVARVAPRTMRTLATIAVDGYTQAGAAGLGRLWVLDGGTLTAIDPRANRRVGKPIRIG